ncbi:MAG TPA: hypothetical protein VJT71_09820 [Pyrinomonadaceae bacterium]|nr:hypothetical protein [Pyrinomonadaceae bacterium]
MNASRIQIPLSLPEPHFDDETTVVTARQVVPLDQARGNDRRQRVLAILPMLLAAAFCGALAAFAVNYFERRATVSTVSQPATETNRNAQTAAPEAIPAQQAASESNEEPTGSSQTSDSVVSDAPSSTASTDNSERSIQPSGIAKKAADPPDPKQLVRQRRVRPVSDQPQEGQNDNPKSRGAGRIQDIFSGPHP